MTDLLFWICIFVGAGLAIALRYAESKVFDLIRWLVGIGIWGGITVAIWVGYSFATLFYSALVLIAFLIVYYPILKWVVPKLLNTGWGAYIPMTDEENAIYRRLKQEHGYRFTRSQIEILVALKKGRTTTEGITKFVNRPIKEVEKDLDELVERGVIEP